MFLRCKLATPQYSASWLCSCTSKSLKPEIANTHMLEEENFPAQEEIEVKACRKVKVKRKESQKIIFPSTFCVKSFETVKKKKQWRRKDFQSNLPPPAPPQPTHPPQHLLQSARRRFHRLGIPLSECSFEECRFLRVSSELPEGFLVHFCSRTRHGNSNLSAWEDCPSQ